MRRCARALVLLGVVVAAVCGAAAGAGAQSAGGGSSSSPVRFADSALHGVEGRDSQVQVVVERTDLPVSRLVVRYRTADGAATSSPALAGSDYVHTTGTLVFEVGAQSSAFTVALRDDEVAEPTEHLVLHLETSSSGNATSARLTVLDDDVESLEPTSASASAAGGTATPSAPASGTRTGAATPPATTPPVVVASSAGVRRQVVVTRTRPRTAARPAPRRIVLQQTPTTPFELRPSAGEGALVPATAVDPLLALAAGLLLARVGAEVWFRVRLTATR